MTYSKLAESMFQKPDASMAAEIERLRALTLPELVARYIGAFGAPPRVKRAEFIWRRIAWRMQEQRFGGLSTKARERVEEIIKELDLPWEKKQAGDGGGGEPRRPVPQRKQAKAANAGAATYERVWRGERVVAVEVEGGLECRGVRYKSLSAVACAVTGTKWNGRLFFGLVDRTREAKGGRS